MSAALVKGLVALLPVCVLLCGSALFFRREGMARAFLQFAGCRMYGFVVLAHVCEAAHFLPAMRWGAQSSPGHYLDLFSAAFALILFPTGLFAVGIRDPKTYRRGAVNGIIQP